jgi:hypothetical protein
MLFITVEANPIPQTITTSNNGKLEIKEICSVIRCKNHTFSNAQTCTNNQAKNINVSHSTSFMICKKFTLFVTSNAHITQAHNHINQNIHTSNDFHESFVAISLNCG